MTEPGRHEDPGAAKRADVRETHTAVLFFAGDRVYKRKKPVAPGFLDHTTSTSRRAACEREIELNRRFAPDVYLDLGELRARKRPEMTGLSAARAAAADYGEGLYTPEWTARTYAELLDRAAALLAKGESVVLDATWIDSAQREAARRTAERTSADLVALHCRVPGDVAAARLRTRAPGASDADAGVADAKAAREEPWPEAVAVDTSGPLGSAVARALAAVRPWGADQAKVFRRPCTEPD